MAAKPVILAVDDDPLALDRVVDELERRYSRDYEIVGEASADVALARIAALTQPLALVLADQWLREPHVTGESVLRRTRELHPGAKRALLVDWGAWGDEATEQALVRAMAAGLIDYYVVKPWRSPDESFHRQITDFLQEWMSGVGPQEIAVIGEPWAPRSHEVRRLLERNGFPHVFHSAASEHGKLLITECGVDEHCLPIVQMLDGRVLVDPSPAELARACGIDTRIADGAEFDVVVVGAGPGGLAAAVYATSEGLSTLVIEREAVGGQAGSSSLIRNYLGFARGISGGELAMRAHQQAWAFGARFLRMRDAVELRAAEGGHAVVVNDGTEIRAQAVVLATGVTYRKLPIPALDALTGAGVFYGASRWEATALAREDVYIVGAGNSAGQAAIHLAKHARQVTMLCRGTDLAATMSQYLRHQIETTPNIEVRLRHEVVGGHGVDRLAQLDVRDNEDGSIATVPAAALFILAGAEPRTSWLPDAIERDEAGYLVTGRPEGTRSLETTVPGVFAVGDVRSGAPKRVAAAVGEGSVVVSQIHDYLTTRVPFMPASS